MKPLRVLVRSKPDREHFALYYLDPETGREVSKSAGTSDRRDAERAAANWERELIDRRGVNGTKWSWFRERFEDEHLSGLSTAGRNAYGTALNAFEKVIKVDTLDGVTTSVLSTFRAALIKADYPLSTVANYLTHMRAAMNWAAKVELIRDAPKVSIPHVPKRKLMRGRPVAEAEYQAMLAACSVHGPLEAQYRRFLELLWLSGLRLSEALRLSWDRPPTVVDMRATPYPQLLFHAEYRGERSKAREDDATPIPPDLATWLDATPEDQRRGLVAPLASRAGRQLKLAKATVKISEIGEAAGIVVNAEGKWASAHDLRRAYGTRWAAVVRPLTLQRMMRHASMETTLKYYIGLTNADAGAELWANQTTDLSRRLAREREQARGIAG